jgi:hypothetical protein
MQVKSLAKQSYCVREARCPLAIEVLCMFNDRFMYNCPMHSKCYLYVSRILFNVSHAPIVYANFY